MTNLNVVAKTNVVLVNLIENENISDNIIKKNKKEIIDNLYNAHSHLESTCRPISKTTVDKEKEDMQKLKMIKQSIKDKYFSSKNYNLDLIKRKTKIDLKIEKFLNLDGFKQEIKKTCVKNDRILKKSNSNLCNKLTSFTSYSNLKKSCNIPKAKQFLSSKNSSIDLSEDFNKKAPFLIS